MKKSKQGNSVYMQIGIWLAEDGQIHIASNDAENFHTTVNNKNGSKRCHENLYLKLSRVLAEAGAPYPRID